MSDLLTGLPADDYRLALADYLKTRSEDALYSASQLSQTFVQCGLGPEDIIALHCEAIDDIVRGFSYREKARATSDAHQFLLEVMITYGVRFKEYLEYRLSETMRDAESRLLRERERSLELERIEREKSEILGVIAHELRTPITAVQGNLDLAVRWLSNGQIDPIPRLLGSAREALDRLSRLTADLVEASRGELPELKLSPLPISLVIEQACSWARPSAAAKGVSLVNEEASKEILVLGNSDALLSAMGNLLSNAIRYTTGGGQVVIRQGADEGWAWVEVIDTGIGMTPEVQARIFEKFYRAPAARRQETRGLGLGLSLVQQIVQAHQGRIEVVSSHGEGSTFRIVLPRVTSNDS